MTWCLILFIYSTFPQSTVFIKCMEHNKNVGPTKEKKTKTQMKAKTTHHCHVIFVWHNTHTWRGFVVYWHDVSANTSKSCSFFLDYIHYHFKTVHQRNKKSASRTMISYLPIKHILDCKAFLFFNTVYPSLLKCSINKMKPFMALMSHSTKLINKPCQTP